MVTSDDNEDEFSDKSGSIESHTKHKTSSGVPSSDDNVSGIGRDRAFATQEVR